METEWFIIRQLFEKAFTTLDAIERQKAIEDVILLSDELKYLDEAISERTENYLDTNGELVEMLTVKECTELVPGLTAYSVRQLAFNGKIKSIRAGEGKRGKILINKKSLIDYLNSKDNEQ